PLAPLGRFFRFIWIGFWINAVSGTALLILAPSKLANPAFEIKMTCILLGVIDMLWLRRVAFPRSRESSPARASDVPPLGKALAIASLVLWAGAITAGRLMAYVGPQR